MASFVAVACIDTGADQSMAYIKARAQGCFYVRAVMRVYVNSIVGIFLFSGFNKLSDHVVTVRPARILDADRNGFFGARKTVSNASHIDADGFGHALRQGSRAAVSDFFVYGDVAVGSSFE